VAKLMWRVKLVAERQPGVTTATELACIERDEQANLADLGLRLAEAKCLMAAPQAQIVPMQVAALGECRRSCAACGRSLTGKGYYGARFRSLFGDVPARVRRLLVCPCRGGAGEAKSVAVLDLGKDAVAPELAYVTARYAALAPFGKVAALLSELLPLGGAQHASTVRNRTLRVGTEVVKAHSGEASGQSPAQVTGPVMIGLDGGYVRSRHRREGHHFEVIAGKVIRADGAQHRFAFVRTGPVPASKAFRRVLAAAGVGANTLATVLCDGDALDRLRRSLLRRRIARAMAVAAAAQGAAGCPGRARLVARRGALRARIAGGPRPRTREVALVARALAGVPAQARGPVPLDAAQHRARRGRHRPPAAARRRVGGLPRAQRDSARALRRPASAG
jgi:hypothetical protein